MKFLDTLKDRKFKLSLNDKFYSPLKLGKFFQLEQLKRNFHIAISNKNKVEFKKTLFALIELQTDEQIVNPNFLNVLRSYVEIVNNNALEAEAVFLRPAPVDKTETKTEIKRPRWDYDGRTAALWIDAFARNYGWDLAKILELDINTAAYLYQEILINEQYEKEWQYGLTEFAYPTDSSGKSHFQPLPRPYWMRENIDGVIKTTKIRKDMLPFGVVIDLSGMGVMKNDEPPTEIIPEEPNQTNEIHPE